MDEASTERLDRGESILYYDRMETAIPNSPFLVELGPLPRFDEPSQAEISFALGGVFLLTAFGIAILLHPVIKQFRGVEKTALAIAGGNLSARIDQGRLRHHWPLAGAFNQMADRVETLLCSQRELLQTVSHELRTPLARIKFATELIDTADTAEQRQQRLAAIDDATDRLDDLVGELLTYVRLDAERLDGTGDKKDEAINVDELIDELIDLHAPLYPEIEFKTDVSGAPESILGHRPSVSRAIGNLISNAGKFARSKVVVTVTEKAGRVVFTVDDDGSGITPPDRESIFEPFKRLSVPEGHDAGHVGTGLGLALVKRIAERSGGAIRVTDSALGGASFLLTLPASPSGHGMAQSGSA